MYLPKLFEETRPEIMQALIRSHPLGTWVAWGDGQQVANHVPFILQPAADGTQVLRGHVARANPVARQLGSALPSVIVFQGPQAYITPSWYPSKQTDGKVVPTWNYAVVHAHGLATFTRDRDWLLGNVTELTTALEANRHNPWQVSDAPASFIERMLDAIVGVEFSIQRLEGKWKTSQNRSEADRQGVVQGLLDSADTQAKAMASIVGGD